jgi:hypothetical protein
MKFFPEQALDDHQKEGTTLQYEFQDEQDDEEKFEAPTAPKGRGR